jgi:hypothetical protein
MAYPEQLTINPIQKINTDYQHSLDKENQEFISQNY